MAEKREFAQEAKELFSSPKGRFVLSRILKATKVLDHGFVPGDSYATAFRCGQKSIGAWLIAELGIKLKLNP